MYSYRGASLLQSMIRWRGVEPPYRRTPAVPGGPPLPYDGFPNQGTALGNYRAGCAGGGGPAANTERSAHEKVYDFVMLMIALLCLAACRIEETQLEPSPLELAPPELSQLERVWSCGSSEDTPARPVGIWRSGRGKTESVTSSPSRILTAPLRRPGPCWRSGSRKSGRYP